MSSSVGRVFIGRVGFHREGAHNVKVCRPTPLGNPFKEGVDGSRGDVCEKYAKHLESAYLSDPYVRGAITRIVQAVRDGNDVNLQCWCAPKRCHAEDVKRLVERLLI